MYAKTRGNTKRKARLAILIAFLLLAITGGCFFAGNGDNDSDKNDSPQNSQNNQKPSDIVLNVYFVKFTADDAYLVREEKVIPHTEEVVNAAVEILINDEKSIFPPGTKVLDINIENGIATVNFSREVLSNANVGSTGEALGIQSVVNTLTEFPNIEKVAFQVEGSSEGPARDWWGHIGLYDQPFSRDLSKVYEPAIWITHPSRNQVVGVPLLVKGSARVQEGHVKIRLLDSSGNVLAEGTVTASAAAPERGSFETSLKFDPPSEGKGTLEAFWVDPRDGSEKDKFVVPVLWP